MRNDSHKRVVLTSKEISELFAEAIVTIVLLLLLNVAIVVILSNLVNSAPSLQDAVFQARFIFAENFKTDIFLHFP